MAQQPTIPEAKVIFLADAWARGYTLAELEKDYGYNAGTIKKYIVKYLGEEAFEQIKKRKRKEAINGGAAALRRNAKKQDEIPHIPKQPTKYITPKIHVCGVPKQLIIKPRANESLLKYAMTEEEYNYNGTSSVYWERV